MSLDEEEVREALAVLRKLGFAEADFFFREIGIEGLWLEGVEVRRESSGSTRLYPSMFWPTEFESDLRVGVFGPP